MKNLPFQRPKTPYLCGQEAFERRKKSPFSKISGYVWKGVGGGGGEGQNVCIHNTQFLHKIANLIISLFDTSIF